MKMLNFFVHYYKDGYNIKNWINMYPKNFSKFFSSVLTILYNFIKMIRFYCNKKLNLFETERNHCLKKTSQITLKSSEFKKFYRSDRTEHFLIKIFYN